MRHCKITASRGARKEADVMAWWVGSAGYVWNGKVETSAVECIMPSHSDGLLITHNISPSHSDSFWILHNLELCTLHDSFDCRHRKHGNDESAQRQSRPIRVAVRAIRIRVPCTDAVVSTWQCINLLSLVWSSTICDFNNFTIQFLQSFRVCSPIPGQDVF